MFKRLGRWVDTELGELGLTRSDFRLRFMFRGKRYYYETFSLPWWILTTTIMAVTSYTLYFILCCLIIMAP